MMNRSAKGRRLEYKSTAILEAAGYIVVRSAASKGPFDLVALSSSDVLLIQCKASRLPSPAEREAMQLVPAPPNARKLAHVWMPRQRLPRVVEL